MASTEEAIITEELRQEHHEVAGHGVHIVQQYGDWVVWLNTEVQDYDGLCIGSGTDRQEAVTQAVASLEAIVAQLQQPPTQAWPHPDYHTEPDRDSGCTYIVCNHCGAKAVYGGDDVKHHDGCNPGSNS